MSLIVRLAPVVAACAVLVSCQNGSNASGDPYVSNYGSDGGYNPYPGQPGTMQSGSYSPPPRTSAPPTYTAPPAPAPPSDPYAFNTSSAPSAPKPSTSKPGTPKTSTASASKPKAKAPVKKSGGSYQVAKGDTLYGIARKRGSTVAKIKAANGLSSDLIRPGQSLKIP
ncbi:MAG TPA: LysM peptidoglycan-binding domain-containing protein [Prosthecobacter sp.]|nr:LysM peptidoglycan-binding domain-containing protein [Prosthecobacter sp.]